MKKHILIVIGIVVCCIIGDPHLYDKYLMARHVAASAGLAILFLGALLTKKNITLPKSPVTALYGASVGLCALSILWATNFGEAAFQTSQTLLGFLTCTAFFGLLTDDDETTKKALWISAAIILIVDLTFAIIQLLGIHNTSFEQLYRVTGINGHKNLLSIMLFLLSAFLLTAIPEFKSKLLKAIPLVLFAISVTVIIVLKSRAVILSLVTAATVFLILYVIHRKKTVHTSKAKMITTLVAIVLSFVFLTVLLRYLTNRPVPLTAEKSEIEYHITSTSSLAERFLLWDKTYQMVDKHPLFGCGTGNWQIHFPDAGLKGLYRADIWNNTFTKPHNEYLGVLAENGYVGLLLFLVFLCSLLVVSGSAIIATADRKAFVFGTVILSILCGCCVNSLFDLPNSRTEHIVWIGILYAILFRFISSKKGATGSNSIGWRWNSVPLVLSALLLAIGIVRFKGERSKKAILPLYTIDPAGMPLHWHQGKAQKALGDPQAIQSFRKAYQDAPFCKENLNDLGLEEYHTAHDLEKAAFYLKEAIRISPNYLDPYLNLANIYLSENEPQKAKEVADRIYFDEQKRAVMKADAVFFEPSNTEAVRQKIDADYAATQRLRATIDAIIKP